MLSAIDKWWQVTMGVLGEALNFIGYLFYLVFTGVGMLIDFVMSLFRKLAGIESMRLEARGKYIEVGGEGNWTDITYAFITSEAVQTAFWTILAMCVALLVVFTIFAIVKSEFATDAKGAAKGPIIQRAVKSVLNFFLIPVISFVSIYGANMLTKAVAATFNVNADSKYNITNLVFNAGALNANRVSLDNGFANYLLTTDTVYFANKPQEAPIVSMTSMLNKYFAVEEGSVTVVKWTYEKKSDSVIYMNREVVNTFPLKMGDIIRDNGSYGLLNSREGTEQTIDLISIGNAYNVNPTKNMAGYFSLNVKSDEVSSKQDKLKVGETLATYDYLIQLPVSVSYLGDDSGGFMQTVPSCKISFKQESSSGAAYVELQVLYPGQGSGHTYDGKTYQSFKKGMSTIKEEDLDTWWGDDSKFQLCMNVSGSAKTEICSLVNNYLNSINATSEATAKGSVTLWNVLKEVYYTEDLGERVFTGSRPNASQEDINKITNTQRTKSADFINKLFVGDGGWSDGFCKYYYYNGLEEGKKLVDLTEEQIKKQTEEEKSRYLEISAATLHVGPGGDKIWEKAINDDWSVEYTPDYQQTYWKPTSYTRDAVMDTGLVGYFYKFNNMNLILMTFGMVAVAWQYFKLILVFVKRALEMALLFLMAPVVTAIAPLDKGNAESSWRGSWIKQLIMTCIPVFAINIFFIILPLVTSLNPWGEVVLGNNIVNPLYTTYQAFLSIIFIYVGVGMINKASSMLAGFLGTEDMLATGKDLTSKAVGVVGTASKGAAIVAGGHFSGLATAFKGAKSWYAGRKAGNESMNSNIAAAKEDLQSQIDEAEANGDIERASSLKDSLRTIESDTKHKSRKIIEENVADYARQREKDSNMVSKLTGLNQADEQVIASKEEELKKLESQKLVNAKKLKNSGQKWSGSNEEKAYNDKKQQIQDEIKQRQNSIAGRQADLDKYSKWAKYDADNERYYSQMLSAREDKKNATKEGRSAEWEKLQKDGFYKEFADKQKDLNENNPLMKTISNHNIFAPVNWALNKMLGGAIGVGLQIADRKLSSIPKSTIDFVKSADASAGAIIEKFFDPAASGKTISTAEENSARETAKEEKTRKKVWEQEFKREEEKLKKESNKRKEEQEKSELMDLYRAFELFKLNGFNIKGDKIDLQADRNETVAKNYKSIIESRAKIDLANKEKLNNDKDFEKFKKMIKDTQAEGKNKPQSVKLDSSDHNLAEKVSKAIKVINEQNTRELKDINAGIKSMLDYLKKMSGQP